MDQGGGKGVAGADGIGHLNGEAARFNILAGQQKRAAFSASGNADRFKLESAGALAAELFERVAFNSAHLFDQGEFLVAELEHVSLLNKSTNQFRGIRLHTKIHVVKTASRGCRVQQSPGEIARRSTHLLQGAEIDPVSRRREQIAEI